MNVIISAAGKINERINFGERKKTHTDVKKTNKTFGESILYTINPNSHIKLPPTYISILCKGIKLVAM